MKKYIPLFSLIFLIFASLNAAAELTLTWKKIPNKFRQISTGSVNHIWAVNKDGEIFRLEQGTWKKQAGPSLKWVSVGSDRNVWGVGKDGKVYERRKEDGVWEEKLGGLDPDTLDHVAIGQAAYVWGVWKSKRWVPLLAPLGSNEIRAGVKGLKELRIKNKIYKWRASTSSWTYVSGKLRQIAVAPDGSVWGVNFRDEIYRRTGSKWKKIPGALMTIDTTVNGIIFGVNRQGILYRRVGDHWEKIAGAPKNLRKVAVAVELAPGKSRIFGYAIDKDGQVHSFSE